MMTAWGPDCRRLLVVAAVWMTVAAIFTALEEQFRLTLESTKEAVEVAVAGQVEASSGNW